MTSSRSLKESRRVGCHGSIAQRSFRFTTFQDRWTRLARTPWTTLLSQGDASSHCAHSSLDAAAVPLLRTPWPRLLPSPLQRSWRPSPSPASAARSRSSSASRRCSNSRASMLCSSTQAPFSPRSEWRTGARSCTGALCRWAIERRHWRAFPSHVHFPHRAACMWLWYREETYPKRWMLSRFSLDPRNPLQRQCGTHGDGSANFNFDRHLPADG